MKLFSKRRSTHDTTPMTTILSYHVESVVANSPDHKHAESRNIRIWDYPNNGDVHKARRLAFTTLRNEMDWIAVASCNRDPDSYRGLKLWVDYRVNDRGKKNDGIV